MEFYLTSPNSVAPKKSHKLDAGYDLYCLEDVSIPMWERAKVSTGVVILIPKGYEGKIEGRSSLAYHRGIIVGGGVIDAGYTGEVEVLLFNVSNTNFNVPKGSKIAQLVVHKIFDDEQPLSVQVKTSQQYRKDRAKLKEKYGIDEDARDDGGFGSTGN